MQERLIGDLAIDAIDFIMRSNIGVLGMPEPIPETLATSYTIDRDATFATVMQYLWTYVGNGAPINNPNNYARYRIGRYRYALSQAQLGQERIQHIDLGCGGGTFAHALLELCQAMGIDLNKVTLYGYDHAQEMIRAAIRIHDYIQQFQSGTIPNLHAYSDHESMLEEIPAEPSEPTRYLVTAGYVLANNLDSQTTEEFASIIAAVVRKSGNHPCSLVVYDSSTVRPLTLPYNRLIGSLQANGINVDSLHEETGVRSAELHRQGA